MDSLLPPRHPRRTGLFAGILFNHKLFFFPIFLNMWKAKITTQSKDFNFFTPVWISSATKSKVRWHQNKKKENNSLFISFRISFPHLLSHLLLFFVLIHWSKYGKMTAGSCDPWLFSVLLFVFMSLTLTVRCSTLAWVLMFGPKRTFVRINTIYISS